MKLFLSDVDGVCADFTQYLLTTLNSSLAYQDVTVWNFLDHLLPKHEQVLKDYILKDPDWWASQPVLPGAAEAIDALRRDGWDVVFVTSPWRRCKSWMEVRTEWCVRNLGAREKDVSIVPRKDIFGADAFVDDSLEQLEAAAKGGRVKELFTMAAPYNVKSPYNRMGWPGILRKLNVL